LFLKIRQPMCKHKICIYGYKYTNMDMQFGKFNVDASFKMLCISFNTFFITTLALGSWPRQGFARLRAKRKLESEGKCEGMNPRTPKRASILGVCSPSGLPNFQITITRIKTQWIKKLFISLESYWNLDV